MEDLEGALRTAGLGDEIAAILLQEITAEVAKEERPIEPADLLHGISVLLTASWKLAQIADPATCHARYSELIQSHADAVMRARPRI